MSVILTPSICLISQNKGTSKMFDREVILTVWDIIGYFLEF